MRVRGNTCTRPAGHTDGGTHPLLLAVDTRCAWDDALQGAQDLDEERGVRDALGDTQTHTEAKPSPKRNKLREGTQRVGAQQTRWKGQVHTHTALGGLRCVGVATGGDGRKRQRWAQHLQIGHEQQELAAHQGLVHLCERVQGLGGSNLGGKHTNAKTSGFAQ